MCVLWRYEDSNCNGNWCWIWKLIFLHNYILLQRKGCQDEATNMSQFLWVLSITWWRLQASIAAAINSFSILLEMGWLLTCKLRKRYGNLYKILPADLNKKTIELFICNRAKLLLLVSEIFLLQEEILWKVILWCEATEP